MEGGRMYFYHPRPGLGVCRNCDQNGPLALNGFRRIRWDNAPYLRELNWMWDDGYPGPCELDEGRLFVPAPLRHYCEAWASGAMPCYVFADFLEETFPGQVPDVILALLREPCENPEVVGVVT